MAADLAVQLYSLREECEQDLPGVLRRVGSIGYAGVEFAGFHGHTPTEVAALLSESGLRASSAHSNPPVDDALWGVLDDLAAIGCDTMVVPVLDIVDPRDSSGVAAMCDQVNQLNAAVRERDLSLGYHNHWWEFEAPDGGPSLYDCFRDGFDPTVFFEVDIYWATVAGVDVGKLLTELGPRAKLLHVKDGPADTPDSAMVAVGDGTLDMDGLLNTHADGAAWHIVELDRCDTDMFDAVEGSYRFLTESGLSRGSE